MGGFGSGKGTRRKAWRSKKRYITSLPEMPVSKLIHAHRGDPNNQFIWGKLRCKIHPSAILLEHDEKIPLEIPEIEISALPCNYGGYRYYGLCPACNRCVRSLYVLKSEDEPRPKGRGLIWEGFRTPPKFRSEIPPPTGGGFMEMG